MIAPTEERIAKIIPGKIFQIDPIVLEDDPIQIRFGGSFVIATNYYSWGIRGYLALVCHDDSLIRNKGFATISVLWKRLECVGEVEWLKNMEHENGEEKNSDGDPVEE